MKLRAASVLTGITACFVTAACRQIPTAPSQRTPVLSLTLIADESLHVATITEASRGDSTIPSIFVGIDPGRVTLQVIDPDGAAHPVTAAGEPGRYVVILPVRRGQRYILVGTIDDESVSAETVVPERFTILVPAADTITAADGVPSLVIVRVPYTLDGDGVSAVEVQVSDGTTNRGQIIERKEGELVFLRSNIIRDVAFVAYNADAAEWLVRSTPRSNLTGAFGGFGAAIVVRRKLWIP